MTEDNRIPELWWSPSEVGCWRANPGKIGGFVPLDDRDEFRAYLPDDAVRLAPESPKAAGNCVNRLCAYERALTEEYPDGIEEDSETLPDPVRAAQRVLDFLRSYGDGRVCVAITPLAEYQIPPLYARDLKALARFADGEIDWQCPESQPEHARLGRAQRCSLKAGHESPHAWVGKQGSLSTWEAK